MVGIKKHAAKDDQLLEEHHQSSVSSFLQNSRKKVPVEDMITKHQMTIQVGIEKRSELSICCLNDGYLQIAIVDFFHCKNIADRIVESQDQMVLYCK